MIATPTINRAADYLTESKRLLPTTLTSRELRGLTTAIKQQSIFAAQVANVRHLDSIRTVLANILSGDMTEAAGRIAIENATSEEYGTARVELIIDTNIKTANGYARMVADNDETILDALPAWELYRIGQRKEPRDWDERWTASCEDAGDEDSTAALEVYNSTGRMIALKSAGVWESLGSSDLWDDALDVNYPPFYFNSGVFGIENITRQECADLGLLDNVDDEVEGADIGEFGENAQADFSDTDSGFMEMVVNVLGNVIFQNGVLSPK